MNILLNKAFQAIGAKARLSLNADVRPSEKMKRRHKVILGIIAIFMALLLADVVAYLRDEQWRAQLRKDLPIGTPVEAIRVYLKDEGQQHGIKGLWEDNRLDYPGFVFRNHNNSIITRSLIDGDIDYALLMGGVRINLDEAGNLKEMHVFK